MINPNKLRPFGRFCVTIGELPTSYLESMTYYEMLEWFCNYLEKTVIPSINNNAEALEEVQTKFIELKGYVDNYFNNLDVQEEINNKLDEMVEDGTMAEIINQEIFTDLYNKTKTLEDIELNVLGSSTTQDISVLKIGDKVMLIDSGNVTEASSHLSMLESLGITRIDYVYITHYHYDHAGGLETISQNIDMSEAIIYLPPTPNLSVFPAIETYYNSVQNVITNNNMTAVIPSSLNHEFTIGEVNLNFLNYDQLSYATETNPDYNNCSLCCVMTYGKTKIGFFGDISYSAQEKIAGKVGHLNLSSVEHHGLNSWYYRPFYDEIHPDMCFTQNGFGEATRSSVFLATRSIVQTYLQEQGIPNYPTGVNSTMKFIINGYSVTTDAKSVQYAKNIKGATSLLSSINAKYTQYGANLQLLDLLKYMGHGTFLSTRINSDQPIWNDILDDMVSSAVTTAQLIIYKGGSSAYNQSSSVDSGYIIVMPATSNPLVGMIYSDWYTSDYSSLHITMRPLTKQEWFKFYRNANETTFSTINNSTTNMEANSTKIDIKASGIYNYSIYLKNNTDSAITYTWNNGSTEQTSVVPAHSTFSESNIISLTNGDQMSLPSANLYIRLTGTLSYTYANSKVINPTSYDPNLPAYNSYPEF